MNRDQWIRQFHRWVAVAFTMVVFAIFATLGLGEEPAEWVYFLPLPPLALLLLTGLYLFALPYSVRWSGRRGTNGRR